MPNKRKKDKAMIGGYVAKTLAEQFKARADELGMSVKDLLEQLVTEEVRKGTKK